MKKENITLNIGTPNGPYTGSFEPTTKIAEVIAAVVLAKHLESSSKYELYFQGNPLTPTERPLVSFHLSNPAQLELVATGSGV